MLFVILAQSMPNNARMRICGEVRREFCIDYILAAHIVYKTLSIACVIIIIGLVGCIVSFADILDIKTHPDASDSDSDERFENYS